MPADDTGVRGGTGLERATMTAEPRKRKRPRSGTDEELSALGAALQQAKARSILDGSNSLWYVHRAPGEKWQIARMSADHRRIRPR